MTHMTIRGFTLIEILIVLTIIGILATVVLNSLNDARDKGSDAKIQAEMSSLAKQAAFVRSDHGDYDPVCGSNGEAQDADVAELVNSIEDMAGANIACNSNGNVFAVSAPLIEGTHWCIDHTGVTREIGSARGVGVYTCPAS